MKKSLLFLAVAILALSSCRKEPEPEQPAPPIDPYEAFKADATPRWEDGSQVEKNEEKPYTYVIDMGGQLFSNSPKYKIGRIKTANGSSYEFIEFAGTPVVGKPSEPSIRKPSGSVALHSLEILKIENGTLWIVFKETAASLERRVVQ